MNISRTGSSGSTGPTRTSMSNPILSTNTVTTSTVSNVVPTPSPMVSSAEEIPPQHTHSNEGNWNADPRQGYRTPMHQPSYDHQPSYQTTHLPVDMPPNSSTEHPMSQAIVHNIPRTSHASCPPPLPERNQMYQQHQQPQQPQHHTHIQMQPLLPAIPGVPMKSGPTKAGGKGNCFE